ncbi:MAG: hypothetical protein IKT98_05920 [Selenomonadaceae bacterium]|nr:hypothetical protein [Selenomonadaceae bacterium]
MKNFLSALIIFFALNFSLASAEVVTVDGTGRYLVNRNLKEPIDYAYEQAYTEALRNATEHAGLALRSYSRTKDFELDEDIIETAAGAIIEIIGKPKFTNGETNDDHVEIVCKINVQIDTDKAEKLFGKKEWLAEREAKDKKIRELQEEIQRLKAKSENSNDTQLAKIQTEFDIKQNQFLIAKYERDLDIYDFDKKINLQDMMVTAEKLAAIDVGNASAFRATVYVYRHEDKIQNVVDYCKEILNANTSVDLSIEACAQLGDIYYNEIFDTPTAKKFVDRGIALVKKKYSKAQIEKLVNGTNVEIKDCYITGRSNTVRELYILKSDIENVNPKFDSISIVKDWLLIEDRIHNIKYRTDW